MKHFTAALFLTAALSQISYSQCNNVLTNGDASGGLTGWTFSTGTGTNWAIQNNTYAQAFVASYNWSTMTQTVDLLAQGFTQQFLNQQPEVSYMQMFKGHTVNYADQYYYKIELLNASNQVLDSYSYGSQTNPITVTSAWDEVAGSFTNYGNGLRYVKVECGGNDAEFWAGHYGTIIDNSIVSVAQIVNVELCSGTYMFNNQSLTQSGTYTGSFTGQYGCDSNVILNLNIGGYNIEDTFDLCDGDTFMFDNQTITTNDTVSGTFLSAAGCDSIVEYVVNFYPTYEDSIEASICPGDIYVFGSQNLTAAGVYTNSFSTSNGGCDSSIVLTLNHYPSENQSISDYLCVGDTFDFGGIPLTAGGNYTETFTNQSGCDSVVSLTLTEDQKYNTVHQEDLCEGDSLFLGNQVITESGVYTENFFTSAGGCDSIITINATLYEIDEHVTVNEEEGKLISLETTGDANYRWLDCNNGKAEAPGQSGRVYSAPQGGRFAVEITRGPCKDTSVCKSIFPLGVFEQSPAADFTIYPSPADAVLTVELHDATTFNRITITNILGEVVYAADHRLSSTLRIPLDGVANGAYSLTLAGKGVTQHAQFVVQH